MIVRRLARKQALAMMVLALLLMTSPIDPCRMPKGNSIISASYSHDLSDDENEKGTTYDERNVSGDQWSDDDYDDYENTASFENVETYLRNTKTEPNATGFFANCRRFLDAFRKQPLIHPTKWPHLVGERVDDARKYLETTYGRNAFDLELVPRGCAVTQDFRRRRIRLFIDENFTVVNTPQTG